MDRKTYLFLKNRYRNKKWLYEQHWIKDLAASEIARKIGVTNLTVLRWMKELDISIRRRKKKNEPLELVCQQCGEKFIISPSRKKCRYCSENCKEYARYVSRTCKWCSREFLTTRKNQQKYCSKFCRSERNRARLREKYRQSPYISKLCAWCKQEFHTKEKSARFCSKICISAWQSETKRGKNSPNWKGGTSFEPYPPEFNKQLKREIRKRDKYCCRICGMTQKEHKMRYKRQLCVHHIDSDKTNNNMNNLVTLCDSCHSRISGTRNLPKITLTLFLGTLCG